MQAAARLGHEMRWLRISFHVQCTFFSGDLHHTAPASAQPKAFKRQAVGIEQMPILLAMAQVHDIRILAHVLVHVSRRQLSILVGYSDTPKTAGLWNLRPQGQGVGKPLPGHQQADGVVSL